MAWFILAGLFSVFAHTGATIELAPSSMSQVWSRYSPSEERNVRHLLEMLSRGGTGRALIARAAAKARQSGELLNDVIRAGEGSLTDTTLIRKFHPERPEDVVFETRSKVYVNRHLAWREALLDLAHELTHYVHREPFNPYTVNFSLADFVTSTIEGKGGEVHAFVSECHVMRELFTQEFVQDSNCGKITDAKGAFSVSRAVELFYHLGGFYPQMKKIVDERGIASHFPHLKEEKTKFVSSAYGLPYPLAAVEEYRTVLSKVCENDRRRLGFMEKGEKVPGRSPASVEKFRLSVEQRCQTVSQN